MKNPVCHVLARADAVNSSPGICERVQLHISQDMVASPDSRKGTGETKISYDIARHAQMIASQPRTSLPSSSSTKFIALRDLNEILTHAGSLGPGCVFPLEEDRMLLLLWC